MPDNNAAVNGPSTEEPPPKQKIRIVVADDHPISFTYNPALAAADGQLKDPGTLTGKVRLDHENQLQCTSNRSLYQKPSHASS